MSDSQQTWIGQKIGGRYPIESLLGRGGMSSVYKGVDPHLRRLVAIKLIHRHLSERPEWVKRFEQEATAVANLRHPNIVQVYDFNKHDNSYYYMVMEYVAGETLDERLRTLKADDSKMPQEDAIRLMVTLCEAIAYAHNQQLIHRDLKPANIMINPEGEPVLMDFGIAKLMDDSTVQTATGTTMGTAAYMSPEQITGQPIDNRSDLYALGVILYEILNGSPPYVGNSAVTVMMKHVNEALPDIRLRNSELTADIVAILEKSLQKDPNNRYQSGSEMADALRALLPETGSYRTTGAASVQPPPRTRPEPTQLREQIKQQPPPPPTSFQAVPPQPVPPREQTAVNPPPSPATTDKRRLPIVPIAIGVTVLAAVLAAIFLLPTFFGGTPSSANMVQIPEGDYTVGLEGGGGQFVASQQVALDSFWIDRFEVTNSQYAAYADETGADLPARWAEGAFPSGEADHPVQGVTWQMASDYCDWADKRLPTETEWEVAARGPNGLLYPWGNETAVVQLTNSSTYPRGGVPANRSQFGIYDMAGNVWEWVDVPYADVPANERVLRGGAYDFQKDMAYRLSGDPSVPTVIATAGFRCAATEVELAPDADTLLLNDDFTDLESGWPSLTEENVLYGYHPPDFYHVQSNNTNTAAAAYFGADYDNISFEADVFVDSIETDNGDFRYGLITRRNADQLYAFTISPQTGTWSILKGSATGLQTLQEGTVAGLSGLSTSDNLRVDVTGNTFVFAINGEVVSQLRDSDYTRGDIGFWVETFDQPFAHVHYDLIEVRQLEAVPLVADDVVAQAEEPAPAAEEADEAAADPEAEPVVEGEPEAVAIPEPTPTPPPAAEIVLPPSVGMSAVEGGDFVLGDGSNVTLYDYWIDSYEVTNAEFAVFVEETGQEAPSYWADSDPLTAMPNHPVRDVTWDMASSYCNWATKRLPTEAEWEVAARGPHGWLYPWGNDRAAVTLPTQDTYPVGSLPTNRSYYGAFDMAGNVWEWVDAPYVPVAEGNRVIRGGANSFQNDMVARPDGDPTSGIMRTNTGIRCAANGVVPVQDAAQLLYDDFADIESGWFQAREPVEAYFFGYHPTDFYHVQVAAPNDCLTVRYERNFANFMAEVEIFVADTDTENGRFRYGLALRENGNAFYALTISSRTQEWQVVKGGLDGMTILAQGTAATIRGDDQPARDRLYVVANGPEMTFFVNGELITKIADGEYADGNVGFLVETLDETYAHLHYDRVTVWELPETTAPPAAQAVTAPSDIVNPLCRGSVSSNNLLLNFTTHTVVQGDTLISIANRYGLPLEAILGANGKTIENPRFISVGQTIIIPQA